MRPLAIELFCGMFGGTSGWLEAGGYSVGFDLQHEHYHGPVPAGADLVLQDVLTLHGSQFKDAAFIWASPPCQNYSYLAMPWSRSKPTPCECRELMMLLPHGTVITGQCNICGGEGFIENSKAAKALRKKWETEGPDNRLFDACFRIQREAIAATEKECGACLGTGREDDEFGYTCDQCGGLGWTERRYIPLIVENVRGAVPWVGPAKAKFGSFYLWGDVAQIGDRVYAGSDLAEMRLGGGVAPEGGEIKVPGVQSWSDFGKPGYKPTAFNGQAERNIRDGVKVPGQIQGKEYAMCRTGAAGQKTLGHVNKRDGHGHTRHLTNQSESDAVREGSKIGGDWFSDPNSTCMKHGSRSNARKQASAMIAKIPFALSSYIAKVHYPEEK